MTGPLAPLAAALYRRIVDYRNRRFDRGKGVITFDRPVISVGNLSVGGTGKSPTVLHLARLLRAHGHWPCIAMRGYGSPPHTGLDSDEALNYRAALPDVPIVAQPDRTAGLIELFGSPEGERIDCILLDDGFQHRRIARAFDLVLIDATRPPFTDRLLPAGWLREPVANLSRAHAALITHAESVTRTDAIDLETRLWNFFPRGTVAVARHAWSSLRAAMPDESEVDLPVSWLAGKKVAAVCAIGNPGPFMAEAERAVGPQGSLTHTLILRDHAPNPLAALEADLAKQPTPRPDAIILTEKDWSKSRRPSAASSHPIIRPQLAMTFDRHQAELESAILAAMTNFDPDATP